ncbi:MAG: hypothetical protein HC771_22800 [Synechococcales cyanobacterium CRU_2_2]|nr:hypothetical protein [Synechococcales cyanobacterium CRU_2_2]
MPPPTIQGTTADDRVYVIREGWVHLLPALFPYVTIVSSLAVALVAISVPEGEREKRDAGFGFAIALLSIGATALTIGSGSGGDRVGGWRSPPPPQPEPWTPTPRRDVSPQVQPDRPDPPGFSIRNPPGKRPMGFNWQKQDLQAEYDAQILTNRLERLRQIAIAAGDDFSN